jgi:hypothetical protein
MDGTGVAMLSGVVHSPRAVQVNVAIIRTFVRLHRLLAASEDLARKVEQDQYCSSWRSAWFMAYPLHPDRPLARLILVEAKG